MYVILWIFSHHKAEIYFLSPFCISRFWECNSSPIICVMLACKRVTQDWFLKKIHNQHSRISDMGYQLRKSETPNDGPLTVASTFYSVTLASTIAVFTIASLEVWQICFFELVRYAQPFCCKLTLNWLHFPILKLLSRKIGI